VGGMSCAIGSLRCEAFVEFFGSEVVGPDGQTARDRTAAMSCVLDIESHRVFAGKVHTGCHVADAACVDDVHGDVFRATASTSGRHVAVHAGAVRIDGDAPVESRGVDTDWIIAVPGR
jgi:hypothetical protein